jgi:2-oxoglutarate ferredoxin oxidoreductase subunit beta
MIHDQFSEDPTYAQILSRMVETPGLPYPMGIFRSVEHLCYEELLYQQIHDARQQMGGGDLAALLSADDILLVD